MVDRVKGFCGKDVASGRMGLGPMHFRYSDKQLCFCFELQESPCRTIHNGNVVLKQVIFAVRLNAMSTGQSTHNSADISKVKTVVCPNCFCASIIDKDAAKRPLVLSSAQRKIKDGTFA